MSAITETFENRNNGTIKIFVTLILVIVTGLLLLVNSHAVEKHGAEEFTMANLCMSNIGPQQTWSKSYMDKAGVEIFLRGFVCQLPDGKFYIIVEQLDGGLWKNVTAFLRKTFSGKTSFTWEEISHYMKSSSWKNCVGKCY